MAQVKGPLFSLSAHKTLGGRLEFSTRRGKCFLRAHQQPTDRRSSAQATERDFFLEASTYWQTLSAEQKQEWATWNAE